MSFTFIIVTYGLFFFTLFFSYIVDRYKTCCFLTSMIVLFCFIDLNANFTGIFERKPDSEILLNKKVYLSLKEYNIPIPKFSVNRFLTDSVTIKKNKIIFPANYVEFDSVKLNYIIFLYIENNTLIKEQSLKYKKLAEEARKENKLLILPLHSDKLKKTRNTQEITAIINKKGETNCYFDIRAFQRKCIFTPIEKLNMTRDFISKAEFDHNLELNFDKVVRNWMIDKEYSEYANNHVTYGVEDSNSIAINWL